MKPINSWKILATIGIVLGTGYGVWAANAIRMVTYFPVPYVAYDKISVTDQFDVGMRKDEPFTLTLDSTTDTPSMKVDTMKLLQVGSGNNQLSIAPDLYSDTVTLGKGDESSAATLNFSNLRIGSKLGDENKPTKELKANTVTVDGKMYMIEDAFKGTDNSAALPGCDGKVHWSELNIGGNKLFLECGGETQPNDDNETCGKGKHWEWELVPGQLVCTLSSDDLDGTSYWALLEQFSGDIIRALIDQNGIFRHSRCSVGGSEWRYRYENGQSNIHFIWSNIEGANNTCETWAINHKDLITEGATCLSLVELGEENVSIPKCNGQQFLNDWNYSIDCSHSFNFQWYSQPNGNAPFCGSGSDCPTLYKAVCVDD